MANKKRSTASRSRTAGAPRGARKHAARLTLTLFAGAAIAIAGAAWLNGSQDTRVTTPALPTTAKAAPAGSGDAAVPAKANDAAANVSADAPKAASTAPQPAAPGVAGQRAFIDPVTGQFRQPEHDELAAIAAAQASAAPARRAARTASTEFFDAGGASSAVVPEELQTFSVATRGPDGRVVIGHAQGAKAADSLVKATSVSKEQRKENRNDR
jgi:hypothetical protein